MGPCAKQRVVAVVFVEGRDTIYGENVCLTPQTVCPRQPGEAYVKCLTHCTQLGHAEETALRQIRMLGIRPSDVSAIHIFGHTGPCDNCRALLAAHGLLDVTTFFPDLEPPLRTQTDADNIALAYNLYAPSSHSKHAAIESVLVSQ